MDHHVQITFMKLTISGRPGKEYCDAAIVLSWNIEIAILTSSLLFPGWRDLYDSFGAFLRYASSSSSLSKITMSCRWIEASDQVQCCVLLEVCEGVWYSGAYPRGGHLGHVPPPPPLSLMPNEKSTEIKRLEGTDSAKISKIFKMNFFFFFLLKTFS